MLNDEPLDAGQRIGVRLPDMLFSDDGISDGADGDALGSGCEVVRPLSAHGLFLDEVPMQPRLCTCGYNNPIRASGRCIGCGWNWLLWLQDTCFLSDSNEDSEDALSDGSDEDGDDCESGCSDLRLRSVYEPCSGEMPDMRRYLHFGVSHLVPLQLRARDPALKGQLASGRERRRDLRCETRKFPCTRCAWSASETCAANL